LPQTSPERVPALTIVAGPNGCGKSTTIAQLAFEGKENLVDGDRIAREMWPDDPDGAAISAGREVIRRTRQYLERQESFVVETTLSSGRTVELISDAQGCGFTVAVVYVCVPDAEIAVLRVQGRVAKGGHDIPQETIRRRYERSIRNAADAFRRADRAAAFDNSGTAARLVLLVEHGVITWRADSPPKWLGAIEQAMAAAG
jgi:predicted ABC-type ATPase